jgi:hypothetical protein
MILTKHNTRSEARLQQDPHKVNEEHVHVHEEQNARDKSSKINSLLIQDIKQKFK